MVRPRSCRVIYYFDTPALGRRHQSFGRVKKQYPKLAADNCKVTKSIKLRKLLNIKETSGEKQEAGGHQINKIKENEFRST